MDILDELKLMLNIKDSSKDDLLNLYITKADRAVRRYLNLSIDDQTDISATYPDAVEQWIVEQFNRKGIEGMKQYMQGSRQGMLETGISDMVKSLLPAPYCRMA